MANNVTKHKAGDAFTFKQEIKSRGTNPFATLVLKTPGNGVDITIKHVASGSVAFASVSMTEHATGKFGYNWQTAQGQRTGIWAARTDIKGTSFQGLKEIHIDIVPLIVIV